MAKNTIKLKNYLHIQEEYAAVAGITPGMLIEVTSTDKVQAHSTAGGNAVTMFACEDELQGKGIGDAYIAADVVQCWIPQRGDQAYGILKDGENVVIGDLLESGGDGYLTKHVADISTSSNYPLQIVGQALEAMDLSGSSGEETSSATIGLNKRIMVRTV